MGRCHVGFARFATVLLITLLCSEAPLQQPPRDGRQPLRTAPQLATEANAHYRSRQWTLAVEEYEAALASEPGLVTAYFFLANAYDNLYEPGRAGEPGNDARLAKAVHYYQLAAERDPDPKMRTLAMEYLVAAYGPEKLNDPARAESILRRMIAGNPSDAHNYAALAKIYEDTGRYDEAEAALLRACDAMPRDPAIRRQLAGFYNRQGNFDKTMEALHAATELDNNNPRAHQLEATYYWEKAYKDHRLPKPLRLEYIQKGMEAADRALALAPDYVDALSFKSLLLRMRSNEETDAAIRSALIVDADALRERAIELNQQRKIAGGGRGSVEVLPGDPPPPPPPAPIVVDGVTAARVGGAVRAPTKLVDVKPVYPEHALRANVQGVVIIEIVIDTHGRVRDARILRSIPGLDDAALEAVRQWEFTPTVLDGVPVPLAMTVTVNFARQP